MLILNDAINTHPNDITISITNVTAATYLGLDFNGNEALGPISSITSFKDLSETTNDKFYYFISAYHTLTAHRNLSPSGKCPCL